MEMKKFFGLPVRLHGDTIECDEFAYATTSCEYIVDGVDSGEAIVEAINKYDQHVERIAELEDKTVTLLQCLLEIQTECMAELTLGYTLDTQSIGESITHVTGLTHPELVSLLEKTK